jgi:hypothetical protein
LRVLADALVKRHHGKIGKRFLKLNSRGEMDGIERPNRFSGERSASPRDH